MPFTKGDKNINRRGRPQGARSKVKADRDIANAIATGMSMQDMCEWLTERIMDDEVTDVQKIKYFDQLKDIKKFLITQEMKTISQDNKDSSKNNQKHTNKQKADVAQFPIPQFKK